MGGDHHTSIGIADCDGSRCRLYVDDRCGNEGIVGSATGVSDSNVVLELIKGGTYSTNIGRQCSTT